MMNTVFLTGVTGFLGSKVAELFLQNGISVIAPIRDNASVTRINHFISNPNLLLSHSGTSLTDPLFTHQVDAVIHTATCYGRNKEPWPVIAEANLILPLQLLVTGEHRGVPCFINADTFFNENMRFEGNEAYYVKTKKDFLEIARHWTVNHAMKFFNLCIEQMYGPNDNPQKFIPTIINKLRTEKDIALTPGEQRRDLIFIDDVARAFLLAFQNREKLGSFEEFGLGTGRSQSIREIVTDLHSFMESSATLQFGQISYRDNEIMDSFADISQNDKIGWKAETDWHEGATRTIESQARR